MKYSGNYNHQGEIFRLWTNCETEPEAHRNFIVQLAERLKRTKAYMRSYFNGSRDNFKITEVNE